MLKQLWNKLRKLKSYEEEFHLKDIVKIHDKDRDEIIHNKRIINGILIDTEKANVILRDYIVTRNINIKKVSDLCKTKSGKYYTRESIWHERGETIGGEYHFYYTIKYYFGEFMSEDFVKKIIGCRDIPKYIEIFGDVEEA